MSSNVFVQDEYKFNLKINTAEIGKTKSKCQIENNLTLCN